MRQTGIFLPVGAEARADRLIALLAADPIIGATGKMTRSVVLRVALMRGLEVLEREYGAGRSS